MAAERKGKVVKLGKSFAIFLPKDWARGNGIRKGSELDIEYGEDVTVKAPRIRRDDHGFAAIVGLIVVVVVVVAVVGFIIMGLSLSAVQPGASCVLKGTTTPVSVTVTLRKGTMDASGNMVRTIVASTVSSPLDGRYSVSTVCGGYFDAVASKTGYDSSMRQSLPFNAGPTTETVDWSLSPTVG